MSQTILRLKTFLSKNCKQSKLYSTVKNVKDRNYQYLQRSKVPTMHFQPSLPRLPIPEIEKSGERFLNALRPILAVEQLASATNNVNNFVKGDGAVLQKMLKEKDKKNKHTSYISEYWFDLYLRDRKPLPINYNPLIVMQNDIKPEYNSQLIRATNLLISSIRFMKSLRDGILEPEIYHMNPVKSDTKLFRTVTSLLPSKVSWYGAYAFKAFPLDMSQFHGLFGGTRIPDVEKDIILRDGQSKHILIQRRGRFYVFDVLDKDGNILPPTSILSRLKYILSDNRPFTKHPLGFLTCQNRYVWARQRMKLENLGNKESLEKIDKAIYNLVLDDEVIGDNKLKVLETYLYGNGANRWFDKSLSLIVTADGVSGINFEHSWGDGVAVLRFFQDIFKETTTSPFVHPDTVVNETDAHNSVRELEINLDDEMKSAIQNAEKDYKTWCDSLSIDYTLYEGLTKQILKKCKVSPDCIMQLAFQAAYHLLHGKYVGTYESCSTSAFKHGRTETMRPCTLQTKEFCDKLHSRDWSKSELRELIAKCSTQHTQLIKEASLGQGFDRHLFALRKIAQDCNIKEPDLFSSYEYNYLNESILSTSTLSSPSVMAGGFGPVHSHGFGIGYSAFANMLGAAVTSYKTQNDSSKYIEALNQSFLDITKILVD